MEHGNDGAGFPTFEPGTLSTWTVEQAGLYRIVAWGARGANGKLKSGGRGACIEATFELAVGDMLDICVGAMSTRAGPVASGGGGGTFLSINGRQSPLLVAGGGGGGGGYATGDADGGDANLDERGLSGRGMSGRGGEGGEGGTRGCYKSRAACGVLDRSARHELRVGMPGGQIRAH